MKRLKRDGDHWLIVGVLGQECARLETGMGFTELIVALYQEIFESQGEKIASWWLDGMTQGILHCTKLCIETNKPLAVYIPPEDSSQ